MVAVNMRVVLPNEQVVEKFIGVMQEIGAKVEMEDDNDNDEIISWEDARRELFSGKTREQIAGGTLRAAREKAGLTQTQLGTMIGVSKHSISQMEHGQRTITPDRAQQFAKAFAPYFTIDYRSFL